MTGLYNAMPQTHAGHTIEELEGNPSEIWSRGDQIEKLGNKMVKAADTLDRIKDGSDGSNGKSMEQVREAVGDMTGDLRKAGTTYAGVGPVLKRYASVIGPVAPNYNDLQGDIKTVVADAEEAWSSYRAADAAVPSTGGMFPTPDKDDPDYDTKAKAASDKEDAFWALADRFDGYYETWESAFNQAAADIDDFVDHGIHDSFWDNVDGVVSGVLTVLKWAGLVVGVLAIIIGGPILGAIAAVVGIAVLLLTVYQKIRGDASWGDLALATIAVIPFGKAFTILKAGKGLRFAKFVEEGSGGVVNLAGRSKVAVQFSDIAAGWKTGSWAGAWKGYTALEGGASFTNTVLRVSTGRSAKQWEDALAAGLKDGGNGLDVADTLARIYYDGHYKRMYKLPTSIYKAVHPADPQPVR